MSLIDRAERGMEHGACVLSYWKREGNIELRGIFLKNFGEAKFLDCPLSQVAGRLQGDGRWDWRNSERGS